MNTTNPTQDPVERFGQRVWHYVLAQLDKVTAWIGIIGLTLQVTGWGSAMFILFVALIILPEGNFSAAFKKLTAGLRSLND